VLGKEFSLGAFTVRIPLGSLADTMSQFRDAVEQAGNRAAAAAREKYGASVQTLQQLAEDAVATTKKQLGAAAEIIQDQASAAAAAVTSIHEQAVAAVSNGIEEFADAAKQAGDDFARGAKELGGTIADKWKDLHSAMVPDAIEKIITDFGNAVTGLVLAPVQIAESFVGSFQGVGGADWAGLAAPAQSGIGLPSQNPFQSFDVSSLLDIGSLMNVDTALDMANFDLHLKDQGSGRWTAGVKFGFYSFEFTWSTVSATDWTVKELIATAGYNFGPVEIFATAAMGAGVPNQILIAFVAEIRLYGIRRFEVRFAELL